MKNYPGRFSRLDIGMAIGKRNDRIQLIIGNTGYHYAGLIYSAHPDRQFEPGELALTIGIVYEVIPAQIFSSLRIVNDWPLIPGFNSTTFSTSR